MDDFSVGKGKQCSALAQSNHDVSLRDEVVESFHEIFGNEIGPALLVVWVLHHRTKHLIANGMHMLKHILGHLEEDDVVLEVLLFELLGSDTKYDEAYMSEELLFRLYLSTTGVSVVSETWSEPRKNA